jgi:beta-glucanase (GH16 family)
MDAGRLAGILFLTTAALREDWTVLADIPFRSLVLILLSVNGVLSGHADTAETEPRIVWAEEFNHGEKPDLAIWSYDLGAGGWGNQELQEYTDLPENVRVEDGHLVITALRKDEGKARFTSARIHTRDKLEMQYGVLVARIKIPDLADGLWPAFWLLGGDFAEVGWPACGELDIMEMGHHEAIKKKVTNRRVGSAAHWKHKDEHATYGLSFDAPDDLDDGFHIYRIYWTPEMVVTHVDGEQVWVFDIRKESCTDCSEFHQPFFILLNLTVGGTYPGIFDAEDISAQFPAEMMVDYIRLYDFGDTELSGRAIPPNKTQ